MAVPLVVFPLAGIGGAIFIGLGPLPVAQHVLPAAGVGAILISEGTVTVPFAVFPLTAVCSAIGKSDRALAVRFAFVIFFAGVHAAIGPRHGALAVVLAVFSLAGVLGAAGSAAVEVGWP